MWRKLICVKIGTKTMTVLFNVMPLFQIRFDILMWVVGLLVIVPCAFALWMQRKEKLKLEKELQMIDLLQGRSIEFDMVLKTMKLAVWKIDVATQKVTFGSDYRDQGDYIGTAEMPMSEFSRRIAEEDRDRIHQNVLQLMEGKINDYYTQYRVKPFSSKQYIWEASYCMVSELSPSGVPLTIVGTSMSIEEQKKTEVALLEARNRAEESDRLKSAFLANMSHEIRTPLNAIVGFSDILPMVQTEEERGELLRLIKDNNAKLLHMIDDIVTMSKIEAGSSDIEKSEFDLCIIVHEMADSCASRNENPDIIVNEQIPKDDIMIKSDSSRVADILDQFINNALKFTVKGSVTVGCDPAKDGFVRIWVKDTGKGIPEEKLDKVFDQFFKLDEFIPGTGLGLPICRAIALMLGGRVGVDSELGVGSTFWAELPVE